MAPLHDRAIEDRIMQCLTAMWESSGETQATIASKLDVSQVTIWQWAVGSMAFPHSLGRLRQLVEISGAGAKLEIKITKDGVEFTF